MSVIGGFINGLNQQGRTVTHNSVEGLIRATLGNRFIETSPADRQENIPQQPQVLPSPESALQNVSEVLMSASMAAAPSGKERQEIPNPQPQFKEPEQPQKPSKKDGPLSPFQRALLTMKDGYEYDEEEIVQQKSVPRPVPKPAPQAEPEYIERDDYVYEEPKPKPIRRKNEYIFHRDTDETFECVVTVEGGSSDDTVARLILKTDMWNIVFDGVIKKNGTCEVPLKKLSLFPDGTTGKAYLEIVVDDVVFVPWESPFRVSTSKKVTIQSPTLNRR